MSPSELALWLLTRGLALAVALYALHRLALKLEERGYLYYRHKKPTGGGGASAGVFNQLDSLTRPSIEHTIEAQDEQVELKEHDGE